MSYTKQESQDQFQKWSRSYDRSILQRVFFEPSHRLLLRHLGRNGTTRNGNGNGKGLRILDIGCGTGRLAERLANHPLCRQLVGVDLCGSMLRHANALGLPERFSWVQADSEHLPFPDHSFDVVTCVHSFHHYPHQGRAVQEMHRVLVPGGQAIIIDGYRDRYWGWLVFDVLVVACEGQVHHPSAQRFRDLFREAGFTRVGQCTLSAIAPILLTTGVATHFAPSELQSGQAACSTSEPATLRVDESSQPAPHRPSRRPVRRVDAPHPALSPPRAWVKAAS